MSLYRCWRTPATRTSVKLMLIVTNVQCYTYSSSVARYSCLVSHTCAMLPNSNWTPICYLQASESCIIEQSCNASYGPLAWFIPPPHFNWPTTASWNLCGRQPTKAVLCIQFWAFSFKRRVRQLFLQSSKQSRMTFVVWLFHSPLISSLGVNRAAAWWSLRKVQSRRTGLDTENMS